MNKNLSEKDVNYITFSVETEEKIIIIERNQNWEINITKTAKLFDKRWRNWKSRNSEVIKTFEILEDRPLVKEIGPKNRKQTFLSLVLALRVLNDYDPVLSYHVFKFYEQDLLANSKEKKIEIENYRKKLEIANAKIAKLKNKPIDINLGGGKFLLYAYECNNRVKFGSSFCNKNGQRPKSHKTSVPNLAIGFVVYSSKETLQELNRAIKRKFKIKRTEHINCKIDELKHFVLEYLELMEFNYKEEDIHQLTKLNIFLAS